jgi:hypothetical protein
MLLQLENRTLVIHPCGGAAESMLAMEIYKWKKVQKPRVKVGSSTNDQTRSYGTQGLSGSGKYSLPSRILCRRVFFGEIKRGEVCHEFLLCRVLVHHLGRLCSHFLQSGCD